MTAQPLAHTGEREGETGGGEVGGTNRKLHWQRAAWANCETPVGEPAACAFQPPVHLQGWIGSSSWQRFTKKASSGLTSSVAVCTRNMQWTLKTWLGLLMRALIQKAELLGSAWGGLGPGNLAAGEFESQVNDGRFLGGGEQQPSCWSWEEEVLGFGFFSNPFFLFFIPLQVYGKKTHTWSWLLGLETNTTLNEVAAELDSLSQFCVFPVPCESLFLFLLLLPNFKRKSEPSPLVPSQVIRALLQGLGSVGLKLLGDAGLEFFVFGVSAVTAGPFCSLSSRKGRS